MKPLSTLTRPVLETVDLVDGSDGDVVQGAHRRDRGPGHGRGRRGDGGPRARRPRRCASSAATRSRELRRNMEGFLARRRERRATSTRRAVTVRVVLVGLPGVGKTTVGRALAARARRRRSSTSTTRSASRCGAGPADGSCARAGRPAFRGARDRGAALGARRPTIRWSSRPAAGRSSPRAASAARRRAARRPAHRARRVAARAPRRRRTGPLVEGPTEARARRPRSASRRRGTTRWPTRRSTPTGPVRRRGRRDRGAGRARVRHVPVDVASGRYEVVVGDGRAPRAGRARSPRGRPTCRAAAIVTQQRLVDEGWLDGLDPGVDASLHVVERGRGCQVARDASSGCATSSSTRACRAATSSSASAAAWSPTSRASSASVHLRGVALVQVPTTLLGQVDAAIGGKNARQPRRRARTSSARSTSRSASCATPRCSRRSRRASGRAGDGEVAKYALLDRRRAPRRSPARRSTSRSRGASRSRRRSSSTTSATTRASRAPQLRPHPGPRARDDPGAARRRPRFATARRWPSASRFAARLAERLGRIGDGARRASTTTVLDGLRARRRAARRLRRRRDAASR